MDIEKLLYRAYKRRKMLANVFFISTTIIASLFVVMSLVELITQIRDMNLGNITELNYKQVGTWIFWGIGFALFFPVYFCSSIKRELNRVKPKIDYLSYCIAELDSNAQDTIISEADHFYKGFASRNMISFGKDCLYGRSIAAHWKDAGYHVILPYNNIKQIIVPASFERSILQKFSEAASMASAVVSVAGLLAGVGSAVYMSAKLTIFIIVDDGGNYHCMSCGVVNAKTNETVANYIAQILERSPDVQIGYIA